MIRLTLKSHAQVNRLAYFPFVLRRCLTDKPTSPDVLSRRIDEQLTPLLRARDPDGKRGISSRGADYLVEMAQDFGFITKTCLPTPEGAVAERFAGPDFSVASPLERTLMLTRLVERDFALFRALGEYFQAHPRLRIDQSLYEGGTLMPVLERAVEVASGFAEDKGDRLVVRDLRASVKKGYEPKTLLHKFKPAFGFWHDTGFLAPVESDALLPIRDSWDATSQDVVLGRFLSRFSDARTVARQVKEGQVEAAAFEIVTGRSLEIPESILPAISYIVQTHNELKNPHYGTSDLHLLTGVVQALLIQDKGIYLARSRLEASLKESRSSMPISYELLPDRWGKPAFFRMTA